MHAEFFLQPLTTDGLNNLKITSGLHVTLVISSNLITPVTPMGQNLVGLDLRSFLFQGIVCESFHGSALLLKLSCSYLDIHDS